MAKRGTVYQRGTVYWIKYYRNGKPYFESSKSTKKMVANKLLEQRLGEIAQGKVPGIHFDRVTFEDLAEGLIMDYKINRKKSMARAKQCITHLSETFARMRVTGIDTPMIEGYIEKRRGKGAKNATVNRELAALKRAFNIGARQTPPKVSMVPYIPMLKESNTRKGFFEHGEFLAIRDALPEYLKGYVTFSYYKGWRKEEVSGLKWSQVDRENWIVRLEPGETKNEDARTVYLEEELKEVFQKQWEARKKSKKLLPYVFPNREGKGKIVDLRKAWKRAAEETGIKNKLFHDFRRTAVRNMVRAGIPERVAMMVSGHKTRSVFDRYNIVNDTDLKIAAQKQEEYIKSQKTVTKTVTIADFGIKKEAKNDT